MTQLAEIAAMEAQMNRPDIFTEAQIPDIVDRMIAETYPSEPIFSREDIPEIVRRIKEL